MEITMIGKVTISATDDWRPLSILSNTAQFFLQTHYLKLLHAPVSVSVLRIHWWKCRISINGRKICFTALKYQFHSKKAPNFNLVLWSSF